MVALRTCIELIEALLYKLTMFGVPIEGTPSVLCDNNSVVTNGSHPESILRKKHCSISYHRIREAVASDTVLLYFERGLSNLADILTKVLPANKRKPIVDALLS